MRKYKQVKRKEVIFSMDEWKVVEDKAASVMMKTGEFIRHIALTGHVTYYNMEAVGDVMKALRIIGANINQLVKKANETHNVYAADVENLRKEVDAISHIHNHIIINAYGIDGRKFNDNQATLKQLREHSDRVCLAFGIKPIEPKQGVTQGIDYNEWEHKRRGTSWKEKIRLEIGGLILNVKNVDELLAELKILGYTVKRGKYISLMDKATRTPAEELRLKMYKPILKRSNITSRSDYEYLKSVISDTKQKAAPLKENFEKCSRLYDLYSEIAKTYYEISREDYILWLVKEKEKQ